MLFRLLGRLLWGTTKITVKYVVIPVAYTAALAATANYLADKVREDTPDANGRVDPVIRPEP